MDLRILEDTGLSNAEARVYLALLEIGQSKTGEIIRHTKLQSSTIYHVLSTLLTKGMISYVHKGKIKYFQAQSPNQFIEFLEEKKRRVIEILPELKEKESLNQQKQNARLYEGYKGVQSAFSDILESLKRGEEYFFVQFPIEKLKNEKVQLFLRSFHLKRSKKGIKVRGLASPVCRNLMQTIYNLPHTRVRYIDDPAPTVMIIYKDKVLFLDWDVQPTAFVIQSKIIADSHRNYFVRKWEKAVD